MICVCLLLRMFSVFCLSICPLIKLEMLPIGIWSNFLKDARMNLKRLFCSIRFTLDIPNIPDFEVDVSDFKDQSAMTPKEVSKSPIKEVMIRRSLTQILKQPVFL